ncbi:MAG: RidA family protein [Rhodospirillaceae bacterium]
MSRTSTTSGSPYETSIGFCRAVRVGHTIVVSGTGPIAADGTTANPGDAYGQAKRCLEIIAHAVTDLGGRMEDVVRTRIYLVHAEDWQEVGRAHGEIFASIKPAATMVVVKELLVKDWLVEIEAECILQHSP